MSCVLFPSSSDDRPREGSGAGWPPQEQRGKGARSCLTTTMLSCFRLNLYVCVLVACLKDKPYRSMYAQKYRRQNICLSLDLLESYSRRLYRPFSPVGFGPYSSRTVIYAHVQIRWVLDLVWGSLMQMWTRLPRLTWLGYPIYTHIPALNRCWWMQRHRCPYKKSTCVVPCFVFDLRTTNRCARK